ncbi:MAG: hypothetical protein OEY03_16850, partial [Rhizobacter sp.]|nr:hypothetical protein [Rhizobacter sp.]
RLGLARIEDDDTVHLVRDSFVPAGDRTRLLGFLGSNVGDHLNAAVANVLSETAPPHLEQAVFADGLSRESLDDFRTLLRTQWKVLLDATAPALQAMIDADHAAGRLQDQRVRVGLYTYHDTMATPPAGAALPTTAPTIAAQKSGARRRAAPRRSEK